jgi:hypothetical protein
MLPRSNGINRGLAIRPAQTRYAVDLYLLLACIVFAAGCRTFVSVPPVDLSSAGWTTYQGQAVWRSSRTAPEIAGDLLLARHGNDRSFVQFIKTPFPILSGQTTPASWQIEFASQRRSFSGRGKPPARLIWLHLSGCLLENKPPPPHWILERLPPAPARPQVWAGGAQPSVPTSLQFRFENKSTGETLEGFLNE